MGCSYGLNRFRLFSSVIRPGALPSILVGLRYALGIMWLTLIVAETIACYNGIGYMTTNAHDFLQTDIVLLGICLYALLKAADMVTRLLERRLLRGILPIALFDRSKTTRGGLPSILNRKKQSWSNQSSIKLFDKT